MDQESINITNIALGSLGVFVLGILLFIAYHVLQIALYRFRLRRIINKRLKQQSRRDKLLAKARTGLWLHDTLTEEIK